MARKSFSKKLKERFDFDTSNLQDYVDEQSELILHKIIRSSNLIGRVTNMTGVKGKEKIKFINVDPTLQLALNCGTPADGGVEFSDREIEVQRLSVRQEFCNEDLISTWPQLRLAAGAAPDDEVAFEDVIVSNTINISKRKHQRLLMLGDTNSTNPELVIYDGFVKLIENDPEVVNVPVNSGTINSTNAFDIAIKLHDAIPHELFDAGKEVEIITGRQEAREILNQIYNDKDYNALLEFSEEDGELSFILPTTNVRVRSYPELNGLSKMMAVPYEYMYYATDETNDEDGFDMKMLESDKLRYSAFWRSGVQIIFPFYFAKIELTQS